MTVKILTQAQKDAIITIYQSRTKTIKDMAKHLGTSPRTVGRVIAEAGLASPTQRLRGEAYHALEFFKEYGLTRESAHEMAHAYMHGPSKTEVVAKLVELSDTDWAAVLADVIHLREAKRYNISVTAAMNKLQNQVNRAEPKSE